MINNEKPVGPEAEDPSHSQMLTKRLLDPFQSRRHNIFWRLSQICHRLAAIFAILSVSTSFINPLPPVAKTLLNLFLGIYSLTFFFTMLSGIFHGVMSHLVVMVYARAPLDRRLDAGTFWLTFVIYAFAVTGLIYVISRLSVD